MSIVKSIKVLLPIVASIITIVNFIISLSFNIDASYFFELSSVINSITINSIIIKVLLFIILQSILSITVIKFCGFLYDKVYFDKFDFSGWIASIISLIICAWVTIFNSRYIFFSNLDSDSDSDSFLYIIGLVAIILVANSISSYVYGSYVCGYNSKYKKRLTCFLEQFRNVFIVHGAVLTLVFLLMYFNQEI